MYSKLQPQQLKLKPARRDDLDRQSYAATTTYQKHYDSALFNAVTAGKTSRYGNALIDDALAICGDPWFQMSNRRYSQKAEDFLDIFRKAVKFFPAPVTRDAEDWSQCHVMRMAASGKSGIVFTYGFPNNTPYECARQRAQYYR